MTTRSGRWLAVFAAALVAALAAACSPVRLADSVALLGDLSAGTAILDAAGGEPVARRVTTFDVDGSANAADLYDGGEARSGLVVVPGAVRAGKDDPRLVAFATALARARFRVLVPDLERMRSLQVSSDDARLLAAAARHLKAEAPDRPLGMVAVSFAAGPAVLAVDAGAPVDFLVSIGGYYDLSAAITFFTTGYFRTGAAAPWQYREPNALGKWLFVIANSARIGNLDDRAALLAMAARKIDDPAAPVADLAAALGPEGRAVHALLANADPDRVPALIGQLPAAMAAEIAALDLKAVDLAAWRRRGLATDIILIHGEGDPVIPETESLAFARALGPDRSDVFLVEGLRHVEAGEVGLSGSLTLLSAAYRVLTLRDGE